VSSTEPERPAETPDGRDPAPAGDAPVGEQPGEPDEHLLVDPARVRRAPRLRAFFTVGAVVGVVVGVALGVWLNAIAVAEDIPMLKPGVFVSVVVLGVTTFFVLLAGAIAVWADRRSVRAMQRR